MPTAWPIKTREFRNHHFDSTVWNGFPFRDDDIVVATYAKAGTTWLQQIVAQLVFAGDPDVLVNEISPWLDLRVPPAEVKLAQLEAQSHRRIIKTHLPVDALVLSPKARYLYVARDGRDIAFSLHHHHLSANALWYELLNDTPGLVGPPIGKPDPDPRAYFRAWLEQDGHPFWSFFENVSSWWRVRELPNVLLVHFNSLKADLEGEMRRIAEFLGVTASSATWEEMVAHCRFDWMKAHARQVAPLGGAIFEGGAESFINKGTNGRWS
ncbi:MAG: sulfotransferase domain-containing protein, partial [Caulobacteraceae bacterium]